MKSPNFNIETKNYKLYTTIADFFYNNFRKKTDTLASAIGHHLGRYGSNHWFRLNLDLQQRHAPVEPMHAMKVNKYNFTVSCLQFGLYSTLRFSRKTCYI